MEQLVSRLACTVLCLPACHTSCESSKRPTELLTSVICVSIFQLRSPWLWHDDRCERPHRLRLGFHGSAGAHTCPRCPRAAHRRTWRGHCCVALSYRIQGGAGPAAPWLLRPGVPLAHRAITAPAPRRREARATERESFPLFVSLCFGAPVAACGYTCAAVSEIFPPSWTGRAVCSQTRARPQRFADGRAKETTARLNFFAIIFASGFAAAGALEILLGSTQAGDKHSHVVTFRC